MSDRQVALTGLAGAVLFAIGNAIWATEQPQAGDPPAELLAFYEDTADRIVVGGSLSLVAIALFLVFASGFRRTLTRADGDDVLGTAAFGGVLLALAAGLGAETINLTGALRANDGDLTPELAQSLFEISYVLGYNAAGVGFAVFAIATAAVGWRRALLPRWLALATFAVGIAMLTPLVSWALLVGIPLLAVIAIQLLRSAPRPAP